MACILPGYDLLSKQQKAVFESSSAGVRCASFIKTFSMMKKDHDDSLTWWGSFSGSNEEKAQLFKETWRNKKHALIDKIKESPEYKTVLLQIRMETLKKEYSYFQLLDMEEMQILANTSFSNTLLPSVLELDEMREVEDRTSKKKRIMRKWIHAFENTPEFESLKIKIKKNISERKRELSFVNQLSLEHHFAYRDTTLDEHNETLLSDLLRGLDLQGIFSIDNDPFYKKWALEMAYALMQQGNTKTPLERDDSLQSYEEALYQHMLQRFRSIHGYPYKTNQIGLVDSVRHSLSALWMSKSADTIKELFNKFGDAHAFIQATGFSSQNEASFAGYLDLYNSYRGMEQIANAKSIFMSLLQPFRPLYEEYKEIALYEKNAFWKVLRTIIPLLIVVAVVVLISALLAPLALSELALAAVFIPALLIGVALSAQYVSIKNDVYQYLRKKYYGGPFEIPEFQVNSRMIHTFHDEAQAQKIRQFYVNALADCDQIDICYRAQQKKGLLSKEEMRLRNENLEKRQQLSLEWYDIHSHYDLNYSDLPSLVLKRLQKESDKEYKALEEALKEDAESIKLWAKKLTSDFKTSLMRPHSVDLSKGAARVTNTQYSPCLFRCLPHKNRMDAIVTLSEEVEKIRAMSSSPKVA